MGIHTLIEYNSIIYGYYKEYNLEFYRGNDPDSFAEKLYYLYSDKNRYNQLKETTKELSKKFKWSSEKKKYLKLVEELINR
jgi:glycosyltransferase involved in cell wall biosynthesis